MRTYEGMLFKLKAQNSYTFNKPRQKENKDIKLNGKTSAAIVNVGPENKRIWIFYKQINAYEA